MLYFFQNMNQWPTCIWAKVHRILHFTTDSYGLMNILYFLFVYVCQIENVSNSMIHIPVFHIPIPQLINKNFNC